MLDADEKPAVLWPREWVYRCRLAIRQRSGDHAVELLAGLRRVRDLGRVGEQFPARQHLLDGRRPAIRTNLLGTLCANGRRFRLRGLFLPGVLARTDKCILDPVEQGVDVLCIGVVPADLLRDCVQFVLVGLLFEDDDMRADARPSALERDGRQLNVGDLVDVFGWS